MLVKYSRYTVQLPAISVWLHPCRAHTALLHKFMLVGVVSRLRITSKFVSAASWVASTWLASNYKDVTYKVEGLEILNFSEEKSGTSWDSNPVSTFCSLGRCSVHTCTCMLGAQSTVPYWRDSRPRCIWSLNTLAVGLIVIILGYTVLKCYIWYWGRWGWYTVYQWRVLLLPVA